ncbi:hypothetical protein JCM19239_1939 [Vibrio variabilis]|uniref:Uncharacterized protein n=1 Tax=Vibrio variabilis TaxID=990271 RepID=A0ABQ0J8D2_9VIBR|nr:hypothetical protein JCM19239_1939 [Vibrio variabilis]
MNTIELCEVANGYRPTNQTIVAVSSEQSKRNLTHDRCDDLVKELYFSRFIKSITITRPEKQRSQCRLHFPLSRSLTL